MSMRPLIIGLGLLALLTGVGCGDSGSPSSSQPRRDLGSTGSSDGGGGNDGRDANGGATGHDASMNDSAAAIADAASDGGPSDEDGGVSGDGGGPADGGADSDGGQTDGALADAGSPPSSFAHVGCLLPNAANYDARATVDSGACLFDLTFNVDVTGQTIQRNVHVLVYDFPSPRLIATAMRTPTGGTCGRGATTCTATLRVRAGPYFYFFAIDYDRSAGTFTPEPLPDTSMTGGGCDVLPLPSIQARGVVVSEANVVTPSLRFGRCETAEGCPDPTATNYRSTATLDNGTCEWNVTFRVDLTGRTIVDQAGLETAPSGIPRRVALQTAAGSPCGPGSTLCSAVVPSRLGSAYFRFDIDDAVETIPDIATSSGACDAFDDPMLNDRAFVMNGGSLTLPVEPFGGCSGNLVRCNDPVALNGLPSAAMDIDACDYTVEFNVDMTGTTLQSGQQVVLLGDFGPLTPSTNVLTDPDGDLVFTLEKALRRGAYGYRFAIYSGTGEPRPEPIPSFVATDTSTWCDSDIDPAVNERRVSVQNNLRLEPAPYGACP